MKYEILESQDSGQLTRIVNEYLNDGWKLHGVLHIFQNTNDQWHYYTQAMVFELDPV